MRKLLKFPQYFLILTAILFSFKSFAADCPPGGINPSTNCIGDISRTPFLPALHTAGDLKSLSTVALADELKASSTATEFLSQNKDLWNGWYIGIHAGSARNEKGAKEESAFWQGSDSGSRSNITNNFIDTPFTSRGRNILRALAGDQNFTDSGFMGGLTVGKNWKFTPEDGKPDVVLGLEADISGVDINGSAKSADLYYRGFSLGSRRSGRFTGVNYGYSDDQDTQSKSQIDWMSTLKARIGFTPIKSTLFYITGGPAIGRVKANLSSRGSYCDVPACLTGEYIIANQRIYDIPGNPDRATDWEVSDSSSQTRLGYAFGAGVEHNIFSNLTIKVEYQRYDLGSVDVENTILTNSGSLSGIGLESSSSTTKRNNYEFVGDMWKIGLNYHF